MYRKIIFILFLVTSVIFVACSNENINSDKAFDNSQSLIETTIKVPDTTISNTATATVTATAKNTTVTEIVPTTVQITTVPPDTALVETTIPIETMPVDTRIYEQVPYTKPVYEGKYADIVQTKIKASYDDFAKDYRVYIPKVNISPEIDEIINGDIEAIFEYETIEQMDKSNGITRINYFYFINDDILSLIVYDTSGTYVRKPRLYCINVDLNRKIILTLPNILYKQGYRMFDVESEIRKNLFHYSSDDYGKYSLFYDGNTNIYIENIMNFYFNKDNELIIILDYVQIINVFVNEKIEFVSNEFYDQYIFYNITTKGYGIIY